MVSSWIGSGVVMPSVSRTDTSVGDTPSASKVMGVMVTPVMFG